MMRKFGLPISLMFRTDRPDIFALDLLPIFHTYIIRTEGHWTLNLKELLECVQNLYHESHGTAMALWVVQCS